MFVRSARAQAKRGGVLRIGIGHGSTTDSLDPATYTNSFMGDVGEGFIGATLTRIDQKNLVQPHLAESFEPSDGARKWVFKLRNGLTFHNGRSLTAADVVATYDYHRSETAKSAARSILSNVVSVAADGAQTVVFMLNSGNADFPFIASDYHLPIFPAKQGGEIEWEKGIMAGPFMIEDFKPGVRLHGKRFPNYHVEGLPYFDEVELLSIVDVGARTNAFVAGEIDYMDRVDLRTIDLLKQNPSIEITNLPAFAHYVAPMNVTVAPFDNVDVRTAIKWAIDREAIVKQVLNGYGLPGNDNPIAPSIQFATNPEVGVPLRSGQGEIPSEEGGLRDPQGRFLGLRRGLSRRRRCRPPDAVAGQGGRHRHQCRPRAVRRLLGQCLYEEAVVRLLLGRPAHHRLDARHRLHIRCGLQRYILEEPEIRSTASRRAPAETDAAKRAANMPRPSNRSMTTAASSS